MVFSGAKRPLQITFLSHPPARPSVKTVSLSLLGALCVCSCLRLSSCSVFLSRYNLEHDDQLGPTTKATGRGR